jgi:predicted phosphodiesterase
MSFITDSLFDLFLHFRLGNGSPSANRLTSWRPSLHTDDGDSQERQTEAYIPPCLFISSDWVAPSQQSDAASRKDYKISRLGKMLDSNQLPQKPGGAWRFCVISDTHERHTSLEIPDCDVLIHAGDILMSSRFISEASAIRKYEKFNEWLGDLKVNSKIKHIFVIGGNHDCHLQAMGCSQAQELLNNATFLSNGTQLISGDEASTAIFGSSASRGASGNKAWQDSGALNATLAAWLEANAGERIDILVTHDVIPDLLWEVKPKIYIYGHVHERYGAYYDHKLQILFICGSIMDSHYNPAHLPVVVDIPVGRLNI